MSKRKQNENIEDDGNYVVPKNRKMNLFAFIVCLLVALIVWIYATNTENKEKAEEAEGSASAAVSYVTDTRVL